MPWANGGSVFSLMSAGEGLAPSVLALSSHAGGKAPKQGKTEKKKKDKDKKEKKARVIKPKRYKA